jgi:hypothetical protein
MLRFIALACLLGVSSLQAQPPKAEPKTEGTFVVHEWGTFLSVQGSDGAGIGGMVESEEVLPKFVINRGPEGWERAQQRANRILYSKMETPVTYFYTDRQRIVGFKATMPKGLLTHWYPTVQAMTPAWKKDEDVSKLVGSTLDWGKFWIDPTGRFARETPVPAVTEGDTWQSLRHTDAAVVRFATGGKKPYDTEKFLFYRGLAAFQLPLQVQSSGQDANLYLRLHNASDEPLTGAFLIWVNRQSIRWAPLSDVGPRENREVIVERTLNQARPLAEGLSLVKQIVSQALVGTGLYAKEASAMVDHWEKSYFTQPGLRVIYILPRKHTDAYIPIDVTPKPTELVRTMVGRVEVLTPDTERQAVDAVEKLNGTDMRALRNAEQYLAGFGRVRAALLRRVAAMDVPAETKKHAEQLLDAKNDGPTVADRPTLHNFIKEALLLGMEAERFPPALARKLGENDENFVEKCSICWAVRDALETHAKTKVAGDPVINADLFANLNHQDKPVRFEALRVMVQGYIHQHHQRLNLSKEARKYLDDEMQQERKRAMQIATSYLPGFQFCPSCDGACCKDKK